MSVKITYFGIAFGVLLMSFLPFTKDVFHLSFYCVPEKIFKEDEVEWQRSWHDYAQHCEDDEIEKQFLKYVLFKSDTPFKVDEIVAYRRDGKLFNKAFGRIEKVNTFEGGWSYEVLTVSGGQVFTEKVLHNWIFAQD